MLQETGELGMQSGHFPFQLKPLLPLLRLQWHQRQLNKEAHFQTLFLLFNALEHLWYLYESREGFIQSLSPKTFPSLIISSQTLS